MAVMHHEFEESWELWVGGPDPRSTLVRRFLKGEIITLEPTNHENDYPRMYKIGNSGIEISRGVIAGFILGFGSKC